MLRAAADKFGDLCTELHQANQRRLGQLLELGVPVGCELEEIEHLLDALLDLGIGAAILFGLGDALAQNSQRRIDLASLPLLHDERDDVPDLLARLEPVTPIPHYVH